MKKIFSVTVLLIGIPFFSFHLMAQVGKVGINTTNPLAMLHVNDSNVLFTGEVNTITTGNPPVNGAGTRLMWYPDKGAFRVGQVDGTQWDKDNIGFNSMAFGQHITASGSKSIAMGFRSVASGDNSTTMGLHTTSRAFGSLTIGQFNDSIASSSPTNWVDTDPVFIIGNGADATNRSNAFVVNKNGNTIISGEVQRPSTGAANLVPIAYGTVLQNSVNSGTGNFTMQNDAIGEFKITLTGITYATSEFVTVVTPSNGLLSDPRIAATREELGKLVIVTYTTSGVKVNAGFHFVVYKL